MNSQTANRLLLIIWASASLGLLVYLGQNSSPNSQAVATRTLLLGLGAAALAVPLGGLLAWVCLGRGLICQSVLIATIALIFVPVFLHVSTWDAAFGRLGWLTSEEGQVLIPLVSGWRAAIWIHGIAATPQIAVLFLLGLMSGKRVFEEQALLETNRLGVFWAVTVQRLWPLAVLAMLWTMIGCAREIAVTDLYQIGTLAEQIYLGFSLGQINSFRGNWASEQLAAADNLTTGVTIAIICWLAITASFLFIRLCNLEWESDQQRPIRRQSSGFWRRVTAVLLLIVLVLIPIGNLVIRCCYSVRPVEGEPTPGYSLEQFLETIGRACRDFTSEFSWTILIAASSASGILMAALLLAWLARKSVGWQLFFIATLAISCAIPGPLMGNLIARLFSFSNNPVLAWFYDRTILAPVLANIWFCWPLSPLVIWYVFRKIADDVLESSRLEGAGGLVQFFRFGLLSNLAAVFGCWLISFSFCCGELSASQIVLPPGIDTIPRRMLGLLHAGVDEMTAALTIVTFGLILSVSTVGWGLIRLNAFRGSRQ